MARGKVLHPDVRARMMWLYRAESSLKFLEQLAAQDPQQLDAWCNKMRTHHKRIIEELLRTAPEEDARIVQSCRVRLSRIP